MRFFYSDIHDLNLPQGHRFPGQKYGMLRHALLQEEVLSPGQLVQSEPASVAMIQIAHSETYVDEMEAGTIDASAMRRIGLPWSPTIPIRARATAGGALSAARLALNDGLSGQLAGGTHHAHRDFGSGYCIYNDFAVAALTLLDDALVSRIAIIDLDVHQGDGNAAILGEHENIFIVSVHGEKNFPFRKVSSSLDVGLPDGIEDEAYLQALMPALERVWTFKPDIILYQAGVDPLREDKLGRMSLTFEGLADRDRLVLNGAMKRNIPVSMAIGGGYADPIELTVKAYTNTYRVAREVYRW